MNTYLAIDPGNTHSAYCAIDRECRPRAFGKVDNQILRSELPGLLLGADKSAIEMIASYGMAVGADVFDTCVWIGRFYEIAQGCSTRMQTIYRRDVKLHHCNSAKAKDANIVQALVDRFAPGQPNKGKGTKNQPGWFHGFVADVWQAFALAVYLADISEGAA